MTKTYSGLCVGGPLARQRRICETDRIDVQLPIDPPMPIGVHEAVPDKASYELFQYRHAQHFYADGDGETVLSFWVPWEESHPRRFVVEELMRAYEAGNG